MAITIKLTAIGDSVGLVLPREVLARLKVEKGDKLHGVETPNGIEFMPYRPDFAAQMDLAEDIMRENRDVLKKLAE